MHLWIPISVGLVAYAAWSEWGSQDCSTGKCHNPPITATEPISKGFDRIRCTITWRRALIAAILASWLIVLVWYWYSGCTFVADGLLFFMLAWTLLVIIYIGLRR